MGGLSKMLLPAVLLSSFIFGSGPLLCDEKKEEPTFTVKAIRACTKGSRKLKTDKAAAHAHLLEAIEYLNKAKEAKEKDNRALYVMGYALLHTDKGKEAGQYIDEAIKVSPSDPRPLNLKATLLKRQKDFDGEISLLEKSLTIKEQRGIAYRLAKALQKRGAPGDLEEAQHYEEMAKKLAERDKLLNAQRELFNNSKGSLQISNVGAPPKSSSSVKSSKGGKKSTTVRKTTKTKKKK